MYRKPRIDCQARSSHGFLRLSRISNPNFDGDLQIMIAFDASCGVLPYGGCHVQS
jgi:hypothetical protein